MRSAWPWLVLLCSVACGGPEGLDAGQDADGGVALDAAADASAVDAAPSGADAGARDGGSSDAGSLDAGSSDAGSLDAGSFDGGASGADASALDAGPRIALRAFETAVPGRRVPYHGNVDLAVGDGAVTLGVLVLHGTNRNADDYFERARVAAEMEGVEATTAIVAPRFVIADDAPDATTLFWDTNGGWKRGDLSTDTLATRISSFEVLDAMVLAFADAARFPSLARIVVVGHSAGGQLAQRFALGSEADRSTSVPIRYVSANPSSYAYLDATRSVAGSATVFAVPTTTCATYDEWKYGLMDLNAHMTRIGAATARTRYRARDVVYLLGEDDDDPAAADLDVGCEASLQGDSRFSRGTIFFGHVADHYGAQPHRRVTVPGVGHSSSRMFRSPEGRAVIFRP